MCLIFVGKNKDQESLRLVRGQQTDSGDATNNEEGNNISQGHQHGLVPVTLQMRVFFFVWFPLFDVLYKQNISIIHPVGHLIPRLYQAGSYCCFPSHITFTEYVPNSDHWDSWHYIAATCSLTCF